MVAPSNTHEAVPYTVTNSLAAAAAVLLAIPISPVVSEVVPSTVRDAVETVVNFCSKLMVLPLDV